MKFSLSMPNYNKSKWVEAAIQSVLAQTYQDWELIIVDDCSDDDSWEKICRFNDPRIKVCRLDRNCGCAASHNVAFKIATGELIGILDSDDVLIPTALEEMVAVAEANPECGFLFSNYDVVGPDLSFIRRGKSHWPPRGGSLMSDKHAASHFKVFRRDAYDKTEGFDESFPVCVDRDITFKMEEVTKFAFLDKSLYIYRWKSGGISQGKVKQNAPILQRAVDNAMKRRGLA